MSYFDELLESGGNFIVQRSEGSASFTPTSEKEGDLQSFQTLVRRLRERDGDGFRIFRERLTSDRAEDFVDLVVVTMEAS